MNYNLSFDAAALFRDLNIQIKFAMAEALAETARAAQANWIEEIYRQTGMYQPYKDRYMLSVMCDVDKTNLTARIYSEDPMATPFETGEAARDMKRMLDTSLKTRVAKGGKHPGQRYLIIPFRHNTPGNTAHAQAMPSLVYAQAMQMAKSKVTGQVSMRSGLNASNIRTKGPLMTMRSSYNWGGRLATGGIVKSFNSTFGGAAGKIQSNAFRNYEGMVRMETSSGKQGRSDYLTFRVMTENSPGWIVPAKPGRFIVKGVAGRAQEMLTFNVQNAIASVAGF